MAGGLTTEEINQRFPSTTWDAEDWTVALVQDHDLYLRILTGIGKVVGREQRRVDKPFTPFEIELVRLKSIGCTMDEISRRTYYHKDTLKYHLKRLFKKCDVNNSTALVAHFVKEGHIV